MRVCGVCVFVWVCVVCMLTCEKGLGRDGELLALREKERGKRDITMVILPVMAPWKTSILVFPLHNGNHVLCTVYWLAFLMTKINAFEKICVNTCTFTTFFLKTMVYVYQRFIPLKRGIFPRFLHESWRNCVFLSNKFWDMDSMN